MTDKLLIDRELLEHVCVEWEHDNDKYMLGRDLRAILAQPAAPADGEAVEVAHHALLPALRQYMHNDGSGLLAGYDYDTTARIVAQRDAKLAGVVEALRGCLELLETICPFEGDVVRKARAALAAAGVEHFEAERDTLRQQLAERDAIIERLETGIPRIQEQSHQMRQQRDKLAGLLREVRVIVAREVERWTRAAAILPVNANVESGLLTRIDAALAEV